MGRLEWGTSAVACCVWVSFVSFSFDGFMMVHFYSYFACHLYQSFVCCTRCPPPQHKSRGQPWTWFPYCCSPPSWALALSPIQFRSLLPTIFLAAALRLSFPDPQNTAADLTLITHTKDPPPPPPPPPPPGTGDMDLRLLLRVTMLRWLRNS